MSEPVTCETHPQVVCYLAGEEGRTWTCPACEIEKLRETLRAAVATLNARTEHLA